MLFIFVVCMPDCAVTKPRSIKGTLVLVLVLVLVLRKKPTNQNTF